MSNEVNSQENKAAPEKHYLVRWEIDAWAHSPTEAARQAWSAMRASDSAATVFKIEDESGHQTTVDLEYEDVCG